jgi:hypothetical protein
MAELRRGEAAEGGSSRRIPSIVLVMENRRFQV